MTLAASTARERAWRSFLSASPSSGEFPLRASIEITRNCNLACVMCPHARPEYADWSPRRDMSPALFERVASELLPRLESAELQGLGESTLSPHWPAFLERLARREGATTLRLVTNLTRVDDALWERTVAAGIDIAVSLDGATAETYEAIRTGARFDSVVRNLELLGRLGARFSLTVVVQRRNLEELPMFVDLAARVGAARVDFARVVSGIPPNRGWRALAGKAPRPLARAFRAVRQAVRPAAGLDGLPDARIVELREAAAARGRALGVETRFKDPLAGPAPRASVPLEALGVDAGLAESESVAAHGRCAKPYLYAVVRHDGDVGLCNHLVGDDHWESMGSLARQDFAAIWDGPAFRRARREHAAGRPLNPACAWCYERRLAD